MVIGELITLRTLFRPAIGIADRVSAQSRRDIFSRRQIRIGGRIRFNQRDFAIGTGDAGHGEIERLFLVPAKILGRITAFLAAFIVYGEAAIRGCAGREAVFGAINGQIRRGIRVAIGVDDGDERG